MSTPTPDRFLSRIVGGLADPPRELDLLTDDQPVKPYPPVHRWRYNAGIRAVLFRAIGLVGSLLLGLGIGLAAVALKTDVGAILTYANAMSIPVIVVAYLLLAMWWERRRPPVELAPRRWTGLLWGLAWGAVLQVICVGLLALFGAYRIQGFDWSYNIVPMLLAAGFGAAINEEILFRGILFRLVEDTFGTWVSVAVSGLVFGLAHLTNSKATLQGALAIALEAGVLFAALYALTRSLWLVMGLHFAWNMVQGPILGIVVSGTSGEGTGYVRSTLEGPAWLAGGGFGMEASLVTVVLLTALAIYLLVVVRRRGLVVDPFWVRRRKLAGRTPPPAVAVVENAA